MYIRKALREVIKEMFHDGESFWIYYKPGWIDKLSGCHGANPEDTKAEAISVASPSPCYCEDLCREHRRAVEDDATFNAGFKKWNGVGK
jgi:hypothetical protein